jgi:hypothetical protein
MQLEMKADKTRTGLCWSAIRLLVRVNGAREEFTCIAVKPHVRPSVGRVTPTAAGGQRFDWGWCPATASVAGGQLRLADPAVNLAVKHAEAAHPENGEQHTADDHTGPGVQPGHGFAEGCVHIKQLLLSNQRQQPAHQRGAAHQQRPQP